MAKHIVTQGRPSLERMTTLGALPARMEHDTSNRTSCELWQRAKEENCGPGVVSWNSVRMPKLEKPSRASSMKQAAQLRAPRLEAPEHQYKRATKRIVLRRTATPYVTK
eukprot:2532509-Amphidinium_carterae.1